MRNWWITGFVAIMLVGMLALAPACTPADNGAPGEPAETETAPVEETAPAEAPVAEPSPEPVTPPAEEPLVEEPAPAEAPAAAEAPAETAAPAEADLGPITADTIEGTSWDFQGIQFAFNPNGELIVNMLGSESKGTWSIEGDTVAVNANNVTYNAKIENGALTYNGEALKRIK